MILTAHVDVPEAGNNDLGRDAWLDSLRSAQRFDALIARAQAGHAEARRAFDAADGPELLRGQG